MVVPPVEHSGVYVLALGDICPGRDQPVVQQVAHGLLSAHVDPVDAGSRVFSPLAHHAIAIAVASARHHRLRETTTRTVTSEDTGFACGFRSLTGRVLSNRRVVTRSRRLVGVAWRRAVYTQPMGDIARAQHFFQRGEFLRSGRKVPSVLDGDPANRILAPVCAVGRFPLIRDPSHPSNDWPVPLPR